MEKIEKPLKSLGTCGSTTQAASVTAANAQTENKMAKYIFTRGDDDDDDDDDDVDEILDDNLDDDGAKMTIAFRGEKGVKLL